MQTLKIYLLELDLLAYASTCVFYITVKMYITFASYDLAKCMNIEGH